MPETGYPHVLEVVDSTTERTITYTDPSAESRTIIRQTKDSTEKLLEEELISKEDGAVSIESIQAEWEARLQREFEDHQNERGPFTAESIPVDITDQELAQDIRAAAAGLDALVERLEEHLEGTYSIDLSEARYEARKAAEYMMCAAHRTKEMADG